MSTLRDTLTTLAEICEKVENIEAEIDRQIRNSTTVNKARLKQMGYTSADIESIRPLHRQGTDRPVYSLADVDAYAESRKLSQKRPAQRQSNGRQQSRG